MNATAQSPSTGCDRPEGCKATAKGVRPGPTAHGLARLVLCSVVAAGAWGCGPAGSTEEDRQLGVDEPTEESTAAAAYPGVSDGLIVFGQSAALSGPAEDLGTNMSLGVRAAFEEANREGGINGRELTLQVRDDGYEPERAIANSQDLLDSGVFALIGAVGTPTSVAAEPMAHDAETPYIGPFTGAEFLRQERPWVVNVRASYYQETEEMVERLTTDLGVTRIAILYQDDSYGQAGLSGVRRALTSRGMGLVSEGRYVRNTSAVKRAVLDIQEGDPEAVIIIGAYLPVATFVKWARKMRLDAIFVNISFVGSNALLNELGADGEGILVTQVVPFPGNTTVPVVGRYQAALEALEPGAAPGFVSLEGYLAGLLTVEALRLAGPHPTREAFLEVLRSTSPIDLGGFEVDFGLRDNQGSDRVYLTEIRGGRFVPLTRLGR